MERVVSVKDGPLVLGPEIVSNPGAPFVNTTGWQATGASTPVSIGVVDGAIEVVADSPNGVRYFTNLGSLEGPAFYFVDIDQDGSVELQLTADADGFPPQSLVTNATGKELIFVSSTGTRYIHMRTAAGNTQTLRGVSVRKVLSIVGYQDSASLRPTAQSVDGNGALVFDLVDDVMTATFPSGFSGDVFFAGRNGCWIERDVTVAAGGTLDIGPDDGPVTAGLLTALGAVIGVVCVDHAITDTERNNLEAFFSARGGASMLESIP